MKHEEFIRLARRLPRDERVPYAFEKRVMANLASATVTDCLALWSQGLWRAVAPCFAVMLLAFAISFQSAPVDEFDEFELENAVITPHDESFDFEA